MANDNTYLAGLGEALQQGSQTLHGLLGMKVQSDLQEELMRKHLQLQSDLAYQNFQKELPLRQELSGQLTAGQAEKITGRKLNLPPETFLPTSILDDLLKQPKSEEPTQFLTAEQAKEYAKTGDKVSGKFHVLPSDTTLTIKEQQQQDALEKQYRDLHTKVLSNRSGGLGLQDAKVNNAIHARSLLDQYYDPNTGRYNVPASAYEELAINVANTISGQNTTTENMINGIRQRTAKGDIAGAIAYITGTTPASSTQQVFKNLADTIDRQGITSEKLRNKYFEQMKSIAPTRLERSRKEQIEKENLGSSYTDYLNQSPSKTGVGGTPLLQTNTEDLKNSIRNKLGLFQ